MDQIPRRRYGQVFKAQAHYNIGNITGAKYHADKAFEIAPGSPALEITRSPREESTIMARGKGV